MSDDPIPISALQHWSFCPRQCALIHLDGVWAENASTFAGNQVHERVDQGERETEGGVRREFGMPLWGERLGLIGRADCVEFRDDG
jgi:CRISPR-associated exonuclease Cas4